MDRARVDCRPYRPADREAVRQLLERTFGDCLGFDRFEFDNPLGEPLRVVAESDGQLVGFNHWIPWRVPCADTAVVAYQSGSSAVSTDARGKGVFAALLAAGEAAARERAIPAFFGFPGPASFNSFLRAGWSHIATMRLRVVLRLRVGRSRAVSPASSGSTSDPFVAWRYRVADVQRADVRTRRFGKLAVYYRTDSMSGVPVLRLLDVLDADGQRRPEAIGPIVAGLPGVGAAVLHASDDDRIARSAAATIPRRWNTPVIMKPIAAEDEVPRLLRETVYFAGDIDSA